MQLLLLAGISALAGNVIQGEVYSWVAVVVLPINSSVNPVIYTLLMALQKKVSININAPLSLAFCAPTNKRYRNGSNKNNNNHNNDNVFI